MEPDRLNRISDLYNAAAARTPSEQRAFLQAACGGDDLLREEVESLLAYESASARFLARPAMALVSLVGRQLGPYQILNPLGAGGMGEVYRAHDTKLGRDVAIKILPLDFTVDPERRARLVREARLLATLNHPNIGAIYGLEEVDGLTALVLELVEGPTLAERLERGPLPLPDALTVARDVADGMEAAHQKNIIHRDLKPANIVLQSGTAGAGPLRAKVLDFGLAKMVAPSHDEIGLTDRQASTGTVDGRILGTPAYMSPEQARGLPVDKRTDIWAFGCVLYEMLTARRPFDGTTAADTLVRVLEHEPDWSAIPAGAPEVLRSLTRRCLQKQPSERLADIGTARQEIADAMAAVPVAPASSTRILSFVGRPIGLGIAGLLVAGVVLGFTFRRDAPRPLVPTRLTSDEGLQTDPSLSPDGRFLTYASNRAGNFDLYTQPVDGGNPVRVTQDPAQDWQPDWSVNAQIVFRSERDNGGLYVVGPTGGNERRVAEFGERPLWSPDGTTILFGRLPSLKLYTVGLDGAPPRLCDVCTGGAYGWFDDNNHVALFSTGPVPQYEPHFRTIDVESGKTQQWQTSRAVATTFSDLRLSVHRSPLAWEPDGQAFYFTGGSSGTSAVWKVEIDRSTRTLTAGPSRVLTMAENATSISVARDSGAMAFAAAAYAPRILWYSLDPSGRQLTGSPVPLTGRDLLSSDADVTPDGLHLAFSVSRPLGSTVELRVKPLPDGVDRTIRTSNAARHEQRQRPRWSPDGQRIVFRYVHPQAEGAPKTHPLLAPQQLRLVNVGTGEESELTTTAPRLVTAGGFSADGKFVVASVGPLQQTVQTMSIVLLPLAAAPKADAQMKIVTTHVGKSGLLDPVMSPNGRWIAFGVQGQTARIAVVGSSDGLWNQPQPEGQWRYVDPIAMYDPRWSIDGTLLYFSSTQDGIANVWAVDFNPLTGDIGKPFQVTQFNGQGELMPLAPAMSAPARGGIAVRTGDPTGGIWLLRRKL